MPNRHDHLGDFVAHPGMPRIAALAIGLGVVSAFLAFALLRLIALFTNLFYFQRVGWELPAIEDNHLGPLVVVVPIVGALIIGFMARYGSERIRGHGIPEAIEAILINGSRVEPKVAMLKPLSSAISIGSGGPFGAEGPIIMTGGAVGSMVAQLLHLTSAERKTLLVAGAAAGMSATFGSPVAATLLAVELLLFEWRPRSMIPVGLAAATAAIVRPFLMDGGALFPRPPSGPIGPGALIACVAVGLLAGALSALLTQAVYTSEDAFARLPIHWMWWPAIGGLVIGLGGLVFPQALGVGYATLGGLIQGDVPRNVILGVLLVKSVIWAVSLGSGTSGGVLAPLLMMGGALGGLEAAFLPTEAAGFWALISMGAILGGTMRSPFTAVIFALELTHDVDALLPLLIAVCSAYGFTVLVLRRSILTEKISRRGLHLSREYAVDPLERSFVRDVLAPDPVVLSTGDTLDEVAVRLADRGAVPGLMPVADAEGGLVGVVTRSDLQRLLAEAGYGGRRDVAGLVRSDPVVAYPDETLRVVVHRMAETGLTRLPVVQRDGMPRPVGVISLTDMLRARKRLEEEENRRERVLRPLLSSRVRRAPRKTEPTPSVS
jgi:H+/Cl- antiporter ClcA